MNKIFKGNCIDRVLPDHLQFKAAEIARQERNGNIVSHNLGLKLLGAAPPKMLISLLNKKLWKNGRTLRCTFLEGTNAQQEKTILKAKIWEKYINLTFDFVSSGDSEIRITFGINGSDTGSWSGVGTDCLVEEYFPKHQPTMNFGWLKDGTEDEEYERVVIHEFGHAIGCIHEHSQPGADLPWDKQAVYKAFMGAPNFWSKADIDSNVFMHYTKEETNSSKFDPDSIMLYQFDGSLFTNGIGTSNNTRLSATDIAFIKTQYPK